MGFLELSGSGWEDVKFARVVYLIVPFICLEWSKHYSW